MQIEANVRVIFAWKTVSSIFHVLKMRVQSRSATRSPPSIAAGRCARTA
jgi:hypothetical protein